jgi:hypothetical protein
MTKFSNSQKGISLYITLILTSIILAIALGISLIFVGQLKMTREIGNSTKAFFAADAGMEQALNLDISTLANINEPDIFGTDYGYTVEIACCNPALHPIICRIGGSVSCPIGLLTDDDCLGQYFCYKSKGAYKDITRAIEIKR